MSPYPGNMRAEDGDVRVGSKRGFTGGDGNETHETHQEAPADSTSKRMERKRQTEKMRRQEMNDRLDELSQVLDLVELPRQGSQLPSEESSGEGCGATSSCSIAGQSGEKSHRVQLLTRAIQSLKNLRYAYDLRTAEVMKLAIKTQQSSGYSSLPSRSSSGELRAPSELPRDSTNGGRVQQAPFGGLSTNSRNDSTVPAAAAAATQHTHPASSEWTREDGTLPQEASSAGHDSHIPIAFTSGSAYGGGTMGAGAAKDCVPMMMVMPIWVPPGCKALAPQVVPVKSDLMSLFSPSSASARGCLASQQLQQERPPQQQPTSQVLNQERGAAQLYPMRPSQSAPDIAARNYDNQEGESRGSSAQLGAQLVQPPPQGAPILTALPPLPPPLLAPAGEDVDVASMAHCA